MLIAATVPHSSRKCCILFYFYNPAKLYGIISHWLSVTIWVDDLWLGRRLDLPYHSFAQEKDI
ncbi:hypothetical protein [Nostoc sp.]|uniref:hypothetical protein n=1 Tax=Nostoc sp. TaxID=1180 RepID=UPI002FF7FE07